MGSPYNPYGSGGGGDGEPTTFEQLDANGDIGSGSAQVPAGDHNHDAAYAPIAKGVTNGDSHDHSGGDGAQIDYNGLANLPTIPAGIVDYVIDESGGGDAAVISTGLAAAGANKTILIRRGTYNGETSNIEILAGQHIIIDGLVTCNSSAALISTADGWTMQGGRFVFNTSKSSGNLVDFNGCDNVQMATRLTATFTGVAMSATGARIVSITGGNNSTFKVHVPAHTFSLNSTSDYVIGILVDGTECRFEVDIQGLTIAQAANAYGVYAQNVVRSIVDMISVNTTTTVGNTGKCLHTVSTDVYSTFRGVATGGDSVNTKTGTGSIYTGLAE